MKRLLTFVLTLFATSFLFAQTYQYSAFPKQIAVWHFTDYNDYWQVIGGTNYTYQHDSLTGLMTNGFYSAYFESNKKVYHIDAGDTLLMYDFNLTVGDTIVANAKFGVDTFYVASDDSLGYHGRRQITLLTNSPYYMPTIWVEGIGNVNGNWGLWSAFSAMSISGGAKFWCQYADSVSIPCNSGLSIDEEVESVSPQVFPNPTTGIFQIKTGVSGFDTFCLYDQLGRKIISGPMQSQLDISVLPNGLYFLHILGKEKTIVEKVIKQ